MTLHPIKALDHVIAEYRDYLRTEFRAKEPALRASRREPFSWPVLAGDDARWAVRAAIDAVVADAYALSRGQGAEGQMGEFQLSGKAKRKRRLLAYCSSPAFSEAVRKLDSFPGSGAGMKKAEDFPGGKKSDGNRWNHCRYTNDFKRPARETSMNRG